MFVNVGRTVTDVLMSVTYELQTKINGDNLRADQRLHNDLIDSNRSTNARWSRQNLFHGQDFVKTLSSALWYIDQHHHTLRERAISIPCLFATFSGYND